MLFKRIWFPFLLSSLSACTAFRETEIHHNTADELYEKNQQAVQDLTHLTRTNVNIHEETWVSKKAIKAHPEKLPKAVDQELTFATGSAMSLSEFSQLINKLCGLSVRLSPDAEAKLTGKLQLVQSNSSEKFPGANEDTVNQLSGIRWKGKLSGLMDIVASCLGISWRYSELGIIDLYYLDTKTFVVYAIPSETDMNSLVQSGISAGISGSAQGESGSGTADGQSMQSTSISMKSNISQDIKLNVEAMLTPGIGRLSASISTGGLTVTDTPETLLRIQKYIEYENKNITKQVLLNVKIVSVQLNDSNQFDINWNLVFDNAAVEEGVATFGFGVSDKKIAIAGGKWKDASLIVEALAQQGKVSVLTSPSVTTLNLQAVPVQIAKQTGYLAKQEVTTTTGVGSSTSLTPGTVTTGFNMNLLPFIMSGDSLLLQYSINLSDLEKLNEVKSEENLIQVPIVNNKIFSQKVKMKSNQTLVLSGFEQNRTESNKKGKGNANFFLFGGGRAAKEDRTVIVIMITPVIME